jgi:hypothetical protein
MAAKLERTKTPGIYKRGTRYVFSYRTDGRQRWESSASFGDLSGSLFRGLPGASSRQPAAVAEGFRVVAG